MLRGEKAVTGGAAALHTQLRLSADPSSGHSAEIQMTRKLQQFFEATGTLSAIAELDRLNPSNQFFNPLENGFDICIEDRIRFSYRRAGDIACRCLSGTTAAELELWHKGSVMGVAAWYEGLVALHVSAVQSGERLVALAGDSGAGKSTLAAALSRHGYPLFADDTLILDSDAGAFVAMPGHKKLKLWDKAFSLAGVARGERLQPGIDKFYAENARVSTVSLLPLTDLVVLVEGQELEPRFRQVTGAGKLKCCADALYRPELYVRIASAQDHAALMLEMSSKLRVWEFVRVRDDRSFEATTQFLAASLATIDNNPEGQSV